MVISGALTTTLDISPRVRFIFNVFCDVENGILTQKFQKISKFSKFLKNRTFGEKWQKTHFFLQIFNKKSQFWKKKKSNLKNWIESRRWSKIDISPQSSLQDRKYPGVS